MAKKPKTSTTPDDMSFEDATVEVEQIIARIESGEIGLEQALAERRRGDALLKRCRAILEAAEQELEQLSIDSTVSTGEAGEPGDEQS